MIEVVRETLCLPLLVDDQVDALHSFRRWKSVSPSQGREEIKNLSEKQRKLLVWLATAVAALRSFGVNMVTCEAEPRFLLLFRVASFCMCNTGVQSPNMN